MGKVDDNVDSFDLQVKENIQEEKSNLANLKKLNEMSLDTIVSEFKTNTKKGLTSKQVANRIELGGYNTIQMEKKVSIFSRFLAQFASIPILILIVAAIVSAIVDVNEGNSLISTFVILAIVFLNAIIGVVQEIKAQKSLDSLKKLSTHTANVLRDGSFFQVDSKDLVVGDIVFLDEGAYIPADCYLFDTKNFVVDESALTGESVGVPKGVLLDEVEYANLAFMSSTVLKGNAYGVVVATGMDTQLGNIAYLLQNTKKEVSPIALKMEKLGKILALIASAVCLGIFVIGILMQKNFLSILMLSISLGVAAIPEGLVAIISIVQSIGIKKLTKQKAIVKNLQALETLGLATIVCTDKTGTLTQNKMTVKSAFVLNGDNIDGNNSSANVENNPNLQMLEYIAANCVTVKKVESGFAGDPTEIALVDYVEKNGKFEKLLEQRVFEIPFESEKKYMIVVCKKGDDLYAYIKGGLEVVALKSANSQKELDILFAKEKEFASKALRVLALGYAKITDAKAFEKMSDDEKKTYIESQKYTLSGVVAIADPPRVGVKEAIRSCYDASIDIYMITGDNVPTALAIAKQIGMKKTSFALTGKEIDGMSDQELLEKLKDCRVIARAYPQTKIRVVQMLKDEDNVVAMTGDGVNDAPSLKLADIGCAMGMCGTDVAKDASDIVIADDNFVTITSAIKQGRVIYDNIIKTIQYLISSNIAEILLILFAICSTNFLATIALQDFATNALLSPLNPLQILFINLVTDSIPALALAADIQSKNIMKRPPKEKNTLFTKDVIFAISYQSILIAIISYIAFVIGLTKGISHGQTLAFLTLGILELVHVFNVRDNMQSAFTNLFTNKKLILATILNVLLLVFVVVFVPNVFGLTTPNAGEIATILILVTLFEVIVETIKFAQRKMQKEKI